MTRARPPVPGTIGAVTERLIRLGVRALVVAIALVAAALAICAFLPGTETHFPDGTEIRSAGGGFIAAPVLAIAAPGVVIWRRPRPWPWLLWAWTAIAVVASGVAFAFMTDVHPRIADVVLWPARTVELGAWILAAMATLGTLLAGFAIQAAEVTYLGDAPLFAARLRRLIVVIAVLGAALVAVGFLPGQAVYDDANNCFGHALGAFGHTEHHHIDCTPSYSELRDTRLAGGLPLAAYVVLLLAPAIVLVRDPRARRAWWWIAWNVGALAAAFGLWIAVEFRLDLFSSTRTLWPAVVVQAGFLGIQVLMFVALPILILCAPPPPIPDARVVARD
jgi:hypothetical protein